MRLIDADRLKEAIHTDFSEHYTLYHDTDQTALFDMVMDDIDEIPTAFDKEKVIDELEYDKEMSAKYSTGLREQGHIEAFDEAISIVKKGGINNILL